MTSSVITTTIFAAAATRARQTHWRQQLHLSSSNSNNNMGLHALWTFQCMLHHRLQYCCQVISISFPYNTKVFFKNLQPCSPQLILTPHLVFGCCSMTLSHYHSYVFERTFIHLLGYLVYI